MSLYLPVSFLLQNTFVLKRRFPPPLHKQGGKLPKMRARHFIYDLIEDTNVRKKPDITVILKQFVDGKINNLVDLIINILIHLHIYNYTIN